MDAKLLRGIATGFIAKARCSHNYYAQLEQQTAVSHWHRFQIPANPAGENVCPACTARLKRFINYIRAITRLYLIGTRSTIEIYKPRDNILAERHHSLNHVGRATNINITYHYIPGFPARPSAFSSDKLIGSKRHHMLSKTSR